MSARLARAVVARPWRVLGAAFLVTCALVPLDLRLRLDADPTHLVPSGGAGAQAFGRFARDFAGEKLLLVLVEGDDSAKLRAFADDYARALAALPQVAEARARLGGGAAALLRDHLTQLLTDDEIDALAPRLKPDALAAQARRVRALLSAPGGSSLEPILTADPLRLLPAVAARLQGGPSVDAQSGYFQSADGRALVIYVRPRAPASDVAADRALLAAAGDAARQLGARVTDGEFSGGGIELGFGGACAYTLYYRDWLHHDASLSTAISAAAVLLLFGLFFRSLRVLPLVALPLAFGLLWTGAAAGALFGRVNAVSLTFGTVLLAIGIDFPIQIYNRLREELATRPPREALERTLTELAAPSLTATLGPALVFFACGFSAYRGLGELGVLAGLGLIFNLIAMLTIFPALLAILPARFWARAAAAPRDSGFLFSLGAAAARRPRRILIVAALALAAAAPLVARVHVERQLTALQPPSMPPVRVDRELAKHFGARDRMLIALVEDRDPERALERADAWRAEAERLKRAGALTGYQSTASLFPSRATQAERRARLDALDPARAAENLRAALDDAGLHTEAFEPFLSQLQKSPPPLTLADAGASGLDFLARTQISDGPDGRRVATFFFPVENDGRARAELEKFAAGPAGGVVTGVPILEEALYRAVTRDTALVTSLSVLAVALLLALRYRRVRPWLAVMGPLALAWAGFGATLALLHLPLNLFNLLSVPLVIGYGIDDHVFLVHRRLADPEGGAARALSTTGRAIVLTSLSTIAGFAGLAAARFDGLRLFGLSGALAVAWCLIAAFAVLPALLAILDGRAADSRL